MATHGCTGNPCTICGIEYQQTDGTALSALYFPPPKYGPRPDLAKRISDKVGTAYGVTVEHVQSWAGTRVSARCKSCEYERWHSISDSLRVTPEEIADCVGAMIVAARGIDGPRCLCVDGLRPSQCLERYQLQQRMERLAGAPRYVMEFVDSVVGTSLTARQLETARAEWSRELRRRVDAGKVQRVEIAVDDDRWEP